MDRKSLFKIACDSHPSKLTVSHIEQACKAQAEQHLFSMNDNDCWKLVKTESILTGKQAVKRKDLRTLMVLCAQLNGLDVETAADGTVTIAWSHI